MIFIIVQQHAEFNYTSEEAEFYAKMTEFISGGKAYAQTLSAKEISQVQLVFIALQKLASSSICAALNIDLKDKKMTKKVVFGLSTITAVKNVRKLLKNTFSQENHRQYSLQNTALNQILCLHG